MGKFLVVLVGLVVSWSAFGAGPDVSGVVGAAQFDTITAAILAVCALIVPVWLVVKGVKLVLRVLKGGAGGGSMTEHPEDWTDTL